MTLGAVRVHGDRYWAIGAPNPAEGHAIDSRDITEKLALANAVSGRRIHNSRSDMAKSFDVVNVNGGAIDPAPDDARYATGKALIAAIDKFDTARHDHGTEVAIETLRDTVTRELDKLIEDPSTFNLTSAAWLIIASGIVPIRDEFLEQMNHGNAPAHAEAWRMVATHAPANTGASAYTLAGFANWLAGDGPKAQVAIEHARGLDPDHSLAQVAEQAITTGLSPVGWEPPATDR